MPANRQLGAGRLIPVVPRWTEGSTAATRWPRATSLRPADAGDSLAWRAGAGCLRLAAVHAGTSVAMASIDYMSMWLYN